MEPIEFNDLTAVLIADRTYQSHLEFNLGGAELEMISDEYFEDIMTGLKEIFDNVIHYQSPKDLIDNASKHTKDIVFTIYGGANSRNRMALVPSICEALNVKYAGADTFARIVCQDKYLSKQFANRFGIKTPASSLIDKVDHLNQIMDLRLPLIVKPNLEGSSIGISDNSKADTYSDAQDLAEHLLVQFKQPILVEEFIPGKEVCICVIGNLDNILLFEAMEVVVESDEDYLLNNVYSAKLKHRSDKVIIHKNVTSELTDDERNKLMNLFKSLCKIDYIRIDGRITANGFVLIELTPDAYLGRDSSFSEALAKKGIPYRDLLKQITHTALSSYHTPYSSYIRN